MPADEPYVGEQYSDASRFNARVETHARYSEAPGSFAEWLLSHVDARRGMRLLDAGCGPGIYHPALASGGVRVTACDLSVGMLRDVAAQAVELAAPVAAAQADAEALPFRDGAFDRVMANHMLYHVADRARALREMRRVLRPGGRAVFATNGARNLERQYQLHMAAAREHGFTPVLPSAFTLDDIKIVRSAFPAARVVERRDALVFPAAAPALRYYASYWIDSIEARPADGSHRPLLLASMERRINEIIQREGTYRVPKSAGCFVADV